LDEKIDPTTPHRTTPHKTRFRFAPLMHRAGRLRKTAFLSHLYIKTIILPRQARDKHRENSKKAAVL
jgi:hypothetical protein